MVELSLFVITIFCFMGAIVTMDRPTVVVTELFFCIAGGAMYYLYLIERSTPVINTTEQALQKHTLSIISAEIGSYCMIFLAAFFFITKTTPVIISATRRSPTASSK